MQDKFLWQTLQFVGQFGPFNVHTIQQINTYGRPFSMWDKFLIFNYSPKSLRTFHFQFKEGTCQLWLTRMIITSQVNLALVTYKFCQLLKLVENLTIQLNRGCSLNQKEKKEKGIRDTNERQNLAFRNIPSPSLTCGFTFAASGLQKGQK